ncbi:TERF1-interacting nuclear factor 2 [Gadus macrocephalus]|uniref:TERF1-interacting nuclear factor 2 n=1 Tax=Gadus macrocephalus TaxID=80720 RepID=UPI0028CB4081|nr:TERF1-interacting nuclear factor 2 [Gadus macrocephalus]
MAAKEPAENDVSLPFPALQLLAPPVRLVSAAVWKVLKQRDVARYGVVEEFVTSVCESVPGMLTFRHQGKLTLGLRGRLILELLSCSPDHPDLELINRHMERFCAPAPCSTAHKLKKDLKIERTVSSFHELVETLLQDPAERLQFFKEEFPEEYGPKFDEELEKLLWEFLIRLDQLLPVPNLVQTVSWLSTAPPVLEECAQAATQPQLLKTILQYQTCLGRLEVAASLPPKMGDSILTSLSLLPSGKPPSAQPTAVGHSPFSRSKPGARRPTDAAENTSQFISPVIGLISNKDVPAMITAAGRKKAAKDKEESERSNGVKRKQPDAGEEEGAGTEEGEEEEEEEEEWSPAGCGTAKRGRRSSKKRRGRPSGRQRSRSKSLSEDGDGEPDTAGPLSEARGARPALFSSCLRQQPMVLLRRLDQAALGTANAEGAGFKGEHDVKNEEDDDDDDNGEQGSSGNVRAKKNVLKISAGKRRKCKTQPPCSDDKENCHVYPGISSPPTITESHHTPGESDDVIGDSEDEATKNFKGMLFVKRYYKTKHDTYVPTLREFCKPWMARPNLLSPG